MVRGNAGAENPVNSPIERADLCPSLRLYFYFPLSAFVGLSVRLCTYTGDFLQPRLNTQLDYARRFRPILWQNDEQLREFSVVFTDLVDKNTNRENSLSMSIVQACFLLTVASEAVFALFASGKFGGKSFHE